MIQCIPREKESNKGRGEKTFFQKVNLVSKRPILVHKMTFSFFSNEKTVCIIKNSLGFDNYQQYHCLF